MAYEEYEDLRKRSDSYNTKYVLYTLDGVGAERNTQLNDVKFLFLTLDLIKEMAKEFLIMEEKLGKKLLVRDENIKLFNDVQIKHKIDFTCNRNPNFTNGDLCSFYFYSENINIDIFKIVYEKCAKKLDNNFSYHFAVQNFETTDYCKGNNLYWVGYAQQFLNNNKKKRIAILNLSKKSKVIEQQNEF